MIREKKKKKRAWLIPEVWNKCFLLEAGRIKSVIYHCLFVWNIKHLSTILTVQAPLKVVWKWAGKPACWGWGEQLDLINHAHLKVNMQASKKNVSLNILNWDLRWYLVWGHLPPDVDLFTVQKDKPVGQQPKWSQHLTVLWQYTETQASPNIKNGRKWPPPNAVVGQKP